MTATKLQTAVGMPHCGSPRSAAPAIRPARKPDKICDGGRPKHRLLIVALRRAARRRSVEHGGRPPRSSDVSNAHDDLRQITTSTSRTSPQRGSQAYSSGVARLAAAHGPAVPAGSRSPALECGDPTCAATAPRATCAVDAAVVAPCPVAAPCPRSPQPQPGAAIGMARQRPAPSRPLPNRSRCSLTKT